MNCNGGTLLTVHPDDTVGVLLGPIEIQSHGTIDGNLIVKVSHSMTPVRKNENGVWEHSLYASDERMNACD